MTFRTPTEALRAIIAKGAVHRTTPTDEDANRCACGSLIEPTSGCSNDGQPDVIVSQASPDDPITVRANGHEASGSTYLDALNALVEVMG